MAKPFALHHGAVLDFPDTVNSVSLAASIAETVTLPADKQFCVFSGTADFYVRYNATATVPGDTTDGTASELNPTIRKIQGLTSMSIISATTCIVTIAFYGK